MVNNINYKNGEIKDDFNRLINNIISDETKKVEIEIAHLIHNSIIEKDENGNYIIELKKYYDGYIQLPDGYGYKGGAARLLLELNLGLNSQAKPRDLDIIRYYENEPKEGLDDHISKKYMPEDYKFGDGVELLEENYFQSRDFSINEVLVQGNKVIFTPQCLKDTLTHTIRPTLYTYDDYYDNHEYSTLIKALRFYVDYQDRYGNANLALINQDQLQDTYRNLFWIALNLDRANGVSEKLGHNLLRLMQSLNKLPSQIIDVEEARKYIEESGEAYWFKFKSIPTKKSSSHLLYDKSYDELHYRERIKKK